MELRFGLEHDVSHALRNPGAYEWWYFDAIDEGGELAFVAIFCLGLPFSPHYREAVREHLQGARPAPDPHDHALLSFSLYRRGRWDAYLLNEYPISRMETATDRPLIRIADNSAEWLPAPRCAGGAPGSPAGKGMFRVRIHDQLRGGGEVEGDLQFHPYHIPPSAAIHTAEPSAHTWVPAAPACSVHGELELRRRRGARIVSFRGTGYHDHNFGAADFTDSMRAWNWGRVHLPEGTLVFYDVTPLAGTPPSQLLVYLDHLTGSVHVLDGTITRSGWRANPFLLASPGRLRLHGVTGGLTIHGSVRARTVVDPGPFYLRFLAEFDIVVEREGTTHRYRETGFAEFLQPARLDWRWTWPMLKTRFIRSTG